MSKNIIFTKKDIKKTFIIKWWQWFYLWLVPTKEQWTEEGYVVRYKELSGKIYITKLRKSNI